MYLQTIYFLHYKYNLGSKHIMIIDLTQQLKAQFSKYPAADSQKTTWFKVSPNLKLYATYSEDIYQALIKIRNILNQNRENYFSNASYSFEAFTESQREELNINIRSNLESVANQINELSDGLKKQTHYNRKTEEYHLNAVVMCLYQLLKSTQSVFAQFQDFSLKRRKKIEETIAFDKIAEKGRYTTPPPVRTSRNREVNDEQLEKESGLLLITKISKQKEMEQAKKQIESIHELMTNMSNVVLEQEFQTSAFLQIGETGLFHIERGNKNLVQANMLAKATGKWWSLLFLSMAFSLLIFDFLKS